MLEGLRVYGCGRQRLYRLTEDELARLIQIIREDLGDKLSQPARGLSDVLTKLPESHDPQCRTAVPIDPLAELRNRLPGSREEQVNSALWPFLALSSCEFVGTLCLRIPELGPSFKT